MKLKSAISMLAFTTAIAVSGLTLASSQSDAHAKAAGWNKGGGEQDAALHLEPNLENGLDVYEVCSACHLPEGWGTKEGTFPQLAGQHRKVIIKQLADIRALNRDNPTMYPFALPESIGDEQAISDVSAYMEKLLMNPDNGKGPATADLVKGKKLYVDNCVKCHGEIGEGDEDKYYPRISGQHYNYMLRQFEWIRDGKRRNANPDMVEQIKGFSQQDMVDVISYVAQIPLPEGDAAPSKDWQNPDFD
ncbi:MAG: c-type cytochrome [gamma proteobacterium symbiont of Bathyaustriella thionipta]|nr:c-type cytochrome [gamma proteobacterium symbiont of Bathyaustriella thionipta]MCU7949222.1 c-type cytochrome [gamma proteobacterium symbiont of Bathyaustriella thionipta]MCU7953689.1 c-type cytochrome [gamma proteobacterium symbiont of Bathyaustriella thionipta]MCU7955810.1 c-type cytochrome [gamma proteobacterium symbiont of Bathyaustriella thionipta]MCU7967904.1 c-type cytochrome [gamma proteobacterium symbiont of Bathyaustriella thionipta]